MAGIIDYQIEKYSFKEASEPARLTSQWAEVLEECRRMGAAGWAQKIACVLRC